MTFVLIDFKKDLLYKIELVFVYYIKQYINLSQDKERLYRYNTKLKQKPEQRIRCI